MEPTIAPADIDETPFDGEKPRELVERLATAKALRVNSQLGNNLGSSSTSTLVVAADTVIDIDGEIFGKPVDDGEAQQMLHALSGRSHHVVTGMAVVGVVDDASVTRTAVSSTEVWLRPLDDEDIAWYLASGEHVGKAGAYAIQGLGSLLVDRIEGSYQGVVGLSLPDLDRLTRHFGWPLRELASP